MIADRYRGASEDPALHMGTASFDSTFLDSTFRFHTAGGNASSVVNPPCCDKSTFSGVCAHNRARNTAEFLTAFIFDACIVGLIFFLSIFIRERLLPIGGLPVMTFRRTSDFWWMLPVWLFSLSYEGFYTKQFSFWGEIGALWKAAFISTVGAFTIIFLAKIDEHMSRSIVVLMGGLAVIIFPFGRIVFKRLMRRFGLFKRRVLILGAGNIGRLLAKVLRRESNFGYEIMGFLDDDPEKIGTRIDGIKVHRGTGMTARYIRKCAISDLVVALEGVNKKKMLWLVNNLQHKVNRILFVPDILGFPVVGTDFIHFSHEEAFALELKNNLANPLNVFVKRLFDFTLSIIVLPFFAVLMAAISLMIKLDSRGPVFFRQVRLGKKGKPFLCIKFRTMHADAEERLSALLEKDPSVRREWEEYWKLREDPRVTRVGKFLRATSLDELPQIFNVLKGQMSLIGPRPYLPHEQNAMGDFAHTILLAKPGISGLWQVSGRSTTNYAYRIWMDNWYVRNWTPWFDAIIMAKTIGVVIKREGAC